MHNEDRLVFLGSYLDRLSSLGLYPWLLTSVAIHWYTVAMKIIATSDLHGILPEIPECDLLLIAGDISPDHDHNRQYQRTWFNERFKPWLKSVPAKHIVGIGGNHDFVLSGHRQKFGYRFPWIYLNNESVEIPMNCMDRQVCSFPRGRCVEPSRCNAPQEKLLKIWGSPLSNPFGNWCNTKPEPALRDVWSTIPRDVDIIMTHGPAYGFGDIAGKMWKRRVMHDGQIISGWEDEHVGSPSLANQIGYEEWPNLKFHVCGHIHGGYGEYEIKSGVKSYNVSHMNDAQEPVNPVVVINI